MVDSYNDLLSYESISVLKSRLMVVKNLQMGATSNKLADSLNTNVLTLNEILSSTDVTTRKNFTT